MAESIHYDPASARPASEGTSEELARLEGRVAEINALLDQLYASGLMRWFKTFVGALPEVSTIALETVNTEQGHAGMRNLLVLIQQLGRFDPDQLERLLEAMHRGIEQADATAAGRSTSAYQPPGVTGLFKLLRDEELWHTLAPLIEGARVCSSSTRQDEDQDDSRQSEAGDDSAD